MQKILFATWQPPPSCEHHEGEIWQVVPRSFEDLALDRHWPYATYVAAETRDELCPGNPEHLIGVTCTKLAVEVHRYRASVNFIPMADHGFMLITDQFATALKTSGLTGFRVKKNVTARDLNRRTTTLHELETTGRGGPAPHYDYTLRCPLCRKGEIICQQCGHINRQCPMCRSAYLFAYDEESAAGNPLCILKESPPAQLFVDKRAWDGSDWFFTSGYAGDHFITTKAKEWLERHNVVELFFRPAILLVNM